MDLARAIAENGLLRAQLEVFEHRLAEKSAALEAAKVELALAHFEVARLRRKLYGDRSEREVPGQSTLPGVELARANDNAKPPPPAPRKNSGPRGPRAKKNAEPLSLRADCVTTTHLHLAPEQTLCTCCGELLKAIGEELSRRIERLPARPQSRRRRRAAPPLAPGAAERAARGTPVGVAQGRASLERPRSPGASSASSSTLAPAAAPTSPGGWGVRLPALTALPSSTPAGVRVARRGGAPQRAEPPRLPTCLRLQGPRTAVSAGGGSSRRARKRIYSSVCRRRVFTA